MQDTNYELRVGLFAIFALILLICGWSWLKSYTMFKQPQCFWVRFSDISGLSRNAPVNVQGLRVGTVDDIEFEPDHLLKLHLRITDDAVRIPAGSKISIQTLGLVGAKYLEVVLPACKSSENTPELTDKDIVRGEDPVRLEVITNKLANQVNEACNTIDSKKANQAIENICDVSARLKQSLDTFSATSTSIREASKSVADTSKKFGVAAVSIDSLATDWKGTTRKVDRLLSDPSMSSNLKETSQQAQKTAETIRAAIREFRATLTDKSQRDELLSLLSKVQHSAETIKESVDRVEKISANTNLRNDIKDIVANSKDVMERFNKLVDDPAFKEDFHATLGQIKSAATNVDTASVQVQAVLNKRAPLIHLLFGRPGRVLRQDKVKPG